MTLIIIKQQGHNMNLQSSSITKGIMGIRKTKTTIMLTLKIPILVMDK